MQPLTTHHRRTTLARAGLFGGLALLVMVMFGGTASIAHAGCGDYVVIGNPLRQTAQHAAAEIPSVMPMEHSNPQPCHGPGCQQGNTLPALPVPTVITLSPEFAAIPPAAHAAITSTGETHVDVRASCRVEGVVDRVERPPRFTALTSLGSRRLSV